MTISCRIFSAMPYTQISEKEILHQNTRARARVLTQSQQQIKAFSMTL